MINRILVGSALVLAAGVFLWFTVGEIALGVIIGSVLTAIFFTVAMLLGMKMSNHFHASARDDIVAILEAGGKGYGQSIATGIKDYRQEIKAMTADESPADKWPTMAERGMPQIVDGFYSEVGES